MTFCTLIVILSSVCLGLCQFSVKNFKDVESIALSIMENLEIRHSIVMQDEQSNDLKWQNIKIFSVNYLYSLFFNKKDLLSYIIQGSFPNVKTLIIIREKNILNVKYILQELDELEILYRISRFTWLIFSNEQLDEDSCKELIVPFDCEFIIVHPLSEIKFHLTEIYSMKNSTIIYDFGTYDSHLGLSVTKIPFHKRRANLNDAELILNSYLPKKLCNSKRACLQLELIEDLSKALNFHFDWIQTPKSNFRGMLNYDVIPKHSDFLQFIYPLHPDFNVFRGDFVGPVFKSNVNWYIKAPSHAKNTDYYVEPLELDSWIALIAFIVIVAVIVTVQRISRKRILGEEDMLNFNNVDGIFMPFEAFCNQEGSENIPFKIISFSLRFTVVFIWAIYGATITSYLTVQHPKIPFTNLEGFVENGKFLISFDARAGRFPQILLEFSRNPVISYVNKHFFKDHKGTKEEDEMCDEKLALMAIDNDIYQGKTKCPIIEVKEPITYSFTVIPMRKNDPFTKILNYIFLNFYSSGVLHRIKRQNFESLIKGETEEDFDPVEMGQMVEVLSIVPIGISISIVLFTLEILLKKIFSRSNKKNTTHLKKFSKRFRKFQSFEQYF